MALRSSVVTAVLMLVAAALFAGCGPQEQPAPSSPRASQVAQPSPAPEPTAQAAPAPQPQQEQATETVYVTRTGSKYHRDGCRYLSQSKIPMTKQAAIANGYSACSVCRP